MGKKLDIKLNRIFENVADFDDNFWAIIEGAKPDPKTGFDPCNILKKLYDKQGNLKAKSLKEMCTLLDVETEGEANQMLHDATNMTKRHYNKTINRPPPD